MYPIQNPLTYTHYNLYSAIYLLANVSMSNINSYGSNISHNLSIIIRDDYEFVIRARDANDFNLPAFSPLSDDYIIHTYPANDGYTDLCFIICLDYLSRDYFLLFMIYI